MNTPSPQHDVVFLVADRNIQAAVQGLLSRREALAIRPLNETIYTHSEHDPGCYLRAQDFLSPFRNRYAYAIVIFDREGCGNETQSRETLEAEVEARLDCAGWRHRARAVVLDAELESWVWSGSPRVDTALGWAECSLELRSWLIDRDWLEQDQVKPDRPKDAMEAALPFVRKPRSSSIYQELAGTVSLRRCTDPAFEKLRATLKEWFPPV